MYNPVCIENNILTDISKFGNKITVKWKKQSLSQWGDIIDCSGKTNVKENR